MSGEMSLTTMLKTMDPLLSDELYVYTCVNPDAYDYSTACKALAIFHEPEGLTQILTKQQADNLGLDYEAEFKCITLQVHSSLQAVGLTSAVSAALTDVGISANVVAAYYHDHVFVPVADSENAMKALMSLSSS